MALTPSSPDAFRALLRVGVSPEQFFGGNGYRAAAFKYFHTESPSQRLGQWLSMRLIEPSVAFYDPDFSLPAVLKRPPWPDRTGRPTRLDVRKLAVSVADRSTHLGEKVENDPEYLALARRIWSQKFVPSVDDLPPGKIRQTANEQVDKVSNSNCRSGRIWPAPTRSASPPRYTKSSRAISGAATLPGNAH